MIAGVSGGYDFTNHRFNGQDKYVCPSEYPSDNKHVHKDYRENPLIQLDQLFYMLDEDSEGSDLADGLQKMSYFINSSAWTAHSKNFTYDRDKHQWILNGSDIEEKFILNNYKLINNTYCNRIYFMVYINKFRMYNDETRLSISISDFCITNNDDLILYYFPKFVDMGNVGTQTWSTSHSYNIFYSYGFTNSLYGFGGNKTHASAAPAYYIKYVPHIKINSNKVKIYIPDSGEIKKPLKVVYKFITDFETYINYDNDDINKIEINSKLLPATTGAYLGEYLIEDEIYEQTLSTKGYYIETDNGYGYTSSIINVPSVTKIIKTPDIGNDKITGYTDTKYSYDFTTLSPVGHEKLPVGSIRYDISNKTWNKDTDLMLKKVLYKSIKFVFNELINNPIQGKYGCPSENLPETSYYELLHAQRNMLFK